MKDLSMVSIVSYIVRILLLYLNRRLGSQVKKLLFVSIAFF